MTMADGFIDGIDPDTIGDKIGGIFRIDDTFAESPAGWLIILGKYGCGKTHLAVAIATLAVEAGYRGYFTQPDTMCRTLVPV